MTRRDRLTEQCHFMMAAVLMALTITGIVEMVVASFVAVYLHTARCEFFDFGVIQLAHLTR